MYYFHLIGHLASAAGPRPDALLLAVPRQGGPAGNGSAPRAALLPGGARSFSVFLLFLQVGLSSLSAGPLSWAAPWKPTAAHHFLQAGSYVPDFRY